MGQRQQEQVQRGCAVGTVVLLGVYAVLYGFHFPLIRQFLGDMTIVHCLMTAASLEGSLRCSGILDGAQAQGHVLQVPALNPNPQRPRANAPLTLWAMHHISL